MNTDHSMTAHEMSLKLQHIIKYEMWNNFPRLDKNEIKLRDTINQQTVFRKDRLKDYIEGIKKKYTNFYQLAYFEDEDINSFYDYLILFDTFKEKLLMSIDLKEVLYKFYEDNKKNEKISKSDFKNLLKINLISLTNQEMIEKNKTWFYLNIDNELFRELYLNENQMLNELIKFNPTFDLESVSIRINFIYPNIEKDLSSFLICKRNIRNLILEISSTQEVILNKNSTMRLCEMSYENFNHSINKILEVILDKFRNKKNLNSLIILCEKSNVILNEFNLRNLNSIFENSSSLIIFIMKNCDLAKENSLEKEIFFNQIYNSKTLRYLHLEALYFDENMFKDFEIKFENIEMRCYRRYDGYHVFNNFNFNDDPAMPELE